MRVLVVKLTSMGDVLHVMPALSDLCEQHADVKVDWMVEDSFAEIPNWHPSVQRTIKVGTRRWRSLKWQNIVEFIRFFKELRKQRYDVVLDAQGLIKSAVFSRLAKLTKGGVRVGFSGASIKESPAAKLYHKKIEVAREQHAIDRLRQLFAGAFDYPFDSKKLNYGLKLPKPSVPDQSAIMLFHGTTWSTKHLPDILWRQIAELAADDGYEIKLTWGNEAERQRAEWIVQDQAHASVLPKSNLTDLALTVKGIAGAIAVDTGLGHLSAALGVPCVSIYGSTNAQLTGAMGHGQVRIQSSYPCSPCLLKQCPRLTEQVTEPPCYKASETNPNLSAAEIWQALYEQIV